MTDTIVVKTRSGRVSKVPVRMKPTEDIVGDDFGDDEHSTDYDVSDEDVCETETEDECDESDEDDNGNLKDFIVSDDDGSDHEDEA